MPSAYKMADLGSAPLSQTPNIEILYQEDWNCITQRVDMVRFSLLGTLMSVCATGYSPLVTLVAPPQDTKGKNYATNLTKSLS